jgi:hypothetical protein
LLQQAVEIVRLRDCNELDGCEGADDLGGAGKTRQALTEQAAAEFADWLNLFRRARD